MKALTCRKCKKEIEDTPFCPLCGASQGDSGRVNRTRGNGQGSVFRLPNGKWRAEVTLGWDEVDGKKKRIVKTKSGFKLKREALAALADLKNNSEENINITFKQMYELWSQVHFNTITKDTEYCYTGAYNYCKAIYYKQFTGLKTHDLQSVVDSCPMGWRTKRNIKVMLTSVYKYAIENDYTNKNYAQFIKLPPKEKSVKDSFTMEERKKLWQLYESGHDFAGYILIMIYTGMRYGEISTIKKDNIHLEEKYIIGGIKTDAGKNRIIPIADKILPIVERLSQNEKLLDIPEKKFYSAFSDALDRAGVRQLKPHACRHTCATALAEAGVQPAIIQQILGHTDYSTTMQYTHIKTDSMMEAINSIE
jgi:integrase